ncbi:MAG: MBL fold metallo-hydrolase RNA specificity domain-containing protein [Candidatus Woesearchaeota archaeon]
MIEIMPLGGFSEIGRNCVIVKYEDEAVMLDLGLHMEHYVKITQEEYEYTRVPLNKLVASKAIPELMVDEFKYVKALCISHAHLDHIGAISYHSAKLKFPINATRFTCEVIRAILKDKRKKDLDLRVRKENETFKVSKNIKVQFINITHSTPQTVVIVVHTPDGCVVYANDFKLDKNPLLGKIPNYEALRNLKNVKALIMDSLYALEDGNTPSESVAKKKIKEAISSKSFDGKSVIATTFSSHIVRLKTLVEIAKDMGRRPVFVGRSLSKYLDAAKAAGIVNFEDEADFVKYGSNIESYFKKASHLDKKFFIVTGHQGEPRAVLSRMVKNNIFRFKNDDVVFFCCRIIPNEDNYRNREVLESALKSKGVEIFKDLHVSGHASKEDHKEFINLLKPEKIIPTHGEVEMLEGQRDICEFLGYKKEDVFILKNFEKVNLD